MTPCIDNRGRTRARGALIAAFLLVFASPPAVASTIAVESYGGSRPRDAAALLAPVHQELASRGYVVGRAASEALERGVSRPSRTQTEAELAAAEHLLADGYRHWIDGEFVEAINTLTRGLDLFRDTPSAVAESTARRDLIFRALVSLAMVHKRQGHAAEATAYMAELIRSFPDRPVDKLNYGPEGVLLYRRVFEDLEQQGHGKLRVTADDPSVILFLNERYMAISEFEDNTLFPGVYRIYVQRASRPGRMHSIDVAAGSDQTLHIPWDFDATLRTGAFAGFVFEDNERRDANESAYAIRAARSAGASQVVVLGVRDQDGRRSVVGTVLSLESGKPFRSAALAIEPVVPDRLQFQALARFLAGEPAAEGIRVTLAVDVSPRERASSGWRWLALGTGGAALAAGTVLWAIDGRGSCDLDPGQRQCERRYGTRTVGLALVGAGVALGVTGIYLWRRDAGAQETAGIAIVPDGEGVHFVFGGTF